MKSLREALQVVARWTAVLVVADRLSMKGPAFGRWFLGGMLMALASLALQYSMVPLLALLADRANLSSFLFSYSLVSVAGAIGVIGLDVALLRYRSWKDALIGARKYILGSIVVGCCAAALTLLVIGRTIDGQTGVYLFLALVPTLGLLQILCALLKIENLNSTAIAARRILPVATLILLAYFASASFPKHETLLLFFWMGNLLAIGFAIVALMRAAPRERGTSLPSIGLIGLAGITGISVLRLVSDHLETLMIGTLGEIAVIAKYAVLVSFSGVTLFGHQCITNLFPQVIARCLEDRDRSALQHVMTFTSRISLAGFWMVVAGFWLLAPQIGRAFDLSNDDWLLFSVLCVGNFINCGTGLCGYLLVLNGQERICLAFIAAGIVLSLALSVVLIPLYGPLGAALSWSASTAFKNVGLSYWGFATLGVRSGFLHFPTVRGLTFPDKWPPKSS